MSLFCILNVYKNIYMYICFWASWVNISCSLYSVLFPFLFYRSILKPKCYSKASEKAPSVPHLPVHTLASWITCSGEGGCSRRGCSQQPLEKPSWLGTRTPADSQQVNEGCQQTCEWAWKGIFLQLSLQRTAVQVTADPELLNSATPRVPTLRNHVR